MSSNFLAIDGNSTPQLQNAIIDGVAQAFEAMPIYLWVVIAAALVLSLLTRVFGNQLLAKFTTIPLLNNSEIRLLKILQMAIPKSHHVLGSLHTLAVFGT